jgi:hypothetical protein
MYTPDRDGCVQRDYFDQMATAAIGELANAGDINLVDSIFVGAVGDDGLVAGVGVVASVVSDVARAGINQYAANYPAAGATAAALVGIVVRNQQMRSNSAGDPCWFEGDVANIVRPDRAGGRIWLALANGATAPGENAHWIVSDTTDHGKRLGSFSAEEIAGDTVEIPSLKFQGVFTAPSSGEIAALAEFSVNGTGTLEQFAADAAAALQKFEDDAAAALDALGS